MVSETLSKRREEIFRVLNSNLDAVILTHVGSNYPIPLPGAKSPQFDFILPEVPLYIFVLGPESLEFEDAQHYGVSREQWEESRKVESTLSEFILGAEAGDRKASVLFIRWGDTISEEKLLRRVGNLLKRVQS